MPSERDTESLQAESLEAGGSRVVVSLEGVAGERQAKHNTKSLTKGEREREIMLAPHPRMPAQQTCGWAWSPGVLESERERQRERDGAAPGGVGTACPSCPRAKQSKTERERERESERSSSESPEIGLVAI